LENVELCIYASDHTSTIEIEYTMKNFSADKDTWIGFINALNNNTPFTCAMMSITDRNQIQFIIGSTHEGIVQDGTNRISLSPSIRDKLLIISQYCLSRRK
jgi:hypothetical protein